MPFEQRRVERQSRRARLDDEPDVDHRDTTRARRRCEAAGVLDHVLLAGMGRRAGRGEGAALADDVVLHVLNDERATLGVERQVLGERRLRMTTGWLSTL